jgi:hypothetical protein
MAVKTFDVSAFSSLSPIPKAGNALAIGTGVGF